MGLLADFFLSRDDDDAIRYDEKPTSFADRLELKRLTELELSTLWAIMRNVEWDVSMLDQFPSILVRDGGERTILRLPDAFLTDLTGLSPADTPPVASKWAATDELGCKADDVLPVIEGLRTLALKASGTQKHVYLWNCV
jgi:hypothetical protein